MKFINYIPLDRHILSSLEHYGFGAVIEVTNGYPLKKRKVVQAKDVRTFFANTTSEKIKLVYGHSYVKSGRRDRLAANSNFNIRIGGFDSIRMRESAIPLLNEGRLNEQSKKKLETILQQSEQTRKSLSHLLGRNKSKNSKIQGVILEKYVASLFDTIMDRSWRRVYSGVTLLGDFEIKDEETKELVIVQKAITEIDILVICYEEKFQNAINSLGERFNKIKTRYREL
jgi:hypothetical protein